MRQEVVMGAAFWFLVSVFLAFSAGRARGDSMVGDEAWQQFRGQVLFSDILFAPPADFPSTGARAASLRRNGRNTVQSTDGFWRLHCVAFLDQEPKHHHRGPAGHGRHGAGEAPRSSDFPRPDGGGGTEGAGPR